MIVRGFEKEKGIDFVDNLNYINFSPTSGLAVARLMMSLARDFCVAPYHLRMISQMIWSCAKSISNKLSCKLIILTKASTAGTSSILLLEVPRLATRTSSTRSCGRSTVVHRHQNMDAYFKSEGFDTIGFEESVWK